MSQIGFSRKEAVYVITALIIILLVAVFYFRSAEDNFREDAETGREEPVSEMSDEPVVSNQEAGAVLSAFPDGFPVEQGVQNQESYKYVPANSREQQSTLVYLSGLTLQENVARFGNFLSANDYEITNEVEEGNFHFFYAVKDGNDLSISIEQQADGQVKINTSYLER